MLRIVLMQVCRPVVLAVRFLGPGGKGLAFDNTRSLNSTKISYNSENSRTYYPVQLCKNDILAVSFGVSTDGPGTLRVFEQVSYFFGCRSAAVKVAPGDPCPFW
jgi:hypothetical protein